MPFDQFIPGDTTLLHILEYSREPAVVYVSPDLHIGFVNQAMMKLWQKKKAILNQRLIDAAPEFSSFIPILMQVWETGKTYAATDTLANIDYNGTLVERYFDFEYRPVFDDDGNVKAIINTALDVTERRLNAKQLELKDLQETKLKNELIDTNTTLLKTQEQLDAINKELELHLSRAEENELFLNRFIMQAPAALTLLRGPKLVYDIFNPKYQQLVPGRNLKGRSIFEALPELVGTPLETILHKVYQEGTPFSIADSLVPIAEIEFGITTERYFTFNFVPWYNNQGQIDGVLNLAYEVTEEVLARKEVVRLNEHLNRLNDQLVMATTAAGIGTWFIEPNTKALNYNAVLAHIFGYVDPEPMTYDQAIAQVLPEFRGYLVAEIENAIASGDYYEVTYQHERFDNGRVIWLRSTGQVAVVNDRGDLAFSGVVQDITRQRMEEQRKDTFIGMVSHELKTPLTSLNGYVQILGGHAHKIQDQFATSLVDKTRRQIVKMTKMINSFLNVSRLESGHINIDKETFDIVELIKEVQEEYVLSYPENQFDLVLCDSVQAFADRDKISQVINNLVSNAVKYSSVGSKIELTCQVDPNWLTITVRDEGIGIPDEDIQKIFARYFRVENQEMRSIAGFGIGLYLCKEIIELHEGEIGVNSDTALGSQFWFKLPSLVS